MSGHTPPPWKWSNGRLFRENRPHGFPSSSSTILVIHDEIWRPHDDDARLIAAAPEIYEAAKELIDNLLEGQAANTEAVGKLLDAVMRVEGKS